MSEIKKIYRRVDAGIWGDDKFLALSPIPPCGRGLWFYFLTGDIVGPLPGLYKAGMARMAEDLDWPMEGFGKAFLEVLREGLIEYDETAKVLYIPNAIDHNAPANPNVLKGWAKFYHVIPDCALKETYYQALKAFAEGLGKGFSKAFDEGFSKGLGKGLTPGTGTTPTTGTGTETSPTTGPPIRPPASDDPGNGSGSKDMARHVVVDYSSHPEELRKIGLSDDAIEHAMKKFAGDRDRVQVTLEELARRVKRSDVGSQPGLFLKILTNPNLGESDKSRRVRADLEREELRRSADEVRRKAKTRDALERAEEERLEARYEAMGDDERLEVDEIIIRLLEGVAAGLGSLPRERFIVPAVDEWERAHPLFRGEEVGTRQDAGGAK